MKPGGWSPLTGKWRKPGLGLLLIAVGLVIAVRTPFNSDVTWFGVLVAPVVMIAGYLLIGVGCVVAFTR